MNAVTLARACLAVLLALFVTKASAIAIIPTEQIYYFSGFCEDCPKPKIPKPPSGELPKEKEPGEAPKEKPAAKDPALGYPASGVLTLTGYTPGTELTNANFVSFSYTSTLFPSLLVTPGQFVGVDDFQGGITGVLPASVPNPADVEIVWIVDELQVDENGDESHVFHKFIFVSSSLDGDWSLCEGKCKVGEKEKVLDIGSAGLWNDTQDVQVPAPGGLPLVVLGIAAALFQRRRPAHTVTA